MRECENKPVSFLRSHHRSQAHEDSLPPESFPAMLHNHREFPRRRLFLQNYLKMRGQRERLWDWKEQQCDEKDQSCLWSLIRSNLYASKTNIPPHFSMKTPNSILIYTLSNLIDFRGIACGRNHQAAASQQ